MHARLRAGTQFGKDQRFPERITPGVFRDIRFERGIVLQLRGEATNAFNMVSLNSPTANLASSLDAKITSAASPRLIQVGARLTF